MITTTAVLLGLLAGANANFVTKRQAAREFLFDNIEPSTDIQWKPCNETQQIYFECARLSVPLDYKDPDNGLRAIIPIVKYPTNATGDAYKGAVLTNPGGPGYLGTEFIYNPRVALGIAANITGPGYDIIGFDIRGVGYSIPYGSCNLTEAELFDFARQNATVDTTKSKRDSRYVYRGSVPWAAKDIETAYGFYIPAMPPSFVNQSLQGAIDLDRACQAYTGADNQAGPYSNTAVIATDMLSIAKAFARARGENETEVKVHYYGVSYGTVLGQTFATLYPNNVGRFVLDGVVDMDGWQQRTEVDIVRNADQGFYEFFKRCFAAGPKKCAFAKGASCTQDVINRFNRMTVRFNATKYEVEGSEFAQPIQYLLTLLKGHILDSLYAAIASWEGLATIFDLLDTATRGPIERWNVTEIGQIMTLPLTPPSNPPRVRPPLDIRTSSFFQTACLDAPSILNHTVGPSEEYLYYSSSAIAGYARLVGRVTCSRFSIRPKWEWVGKIGGKTSTPILFVGNTLDPVTPWDDAVKAAVKFDKAEVVVAELIAHSIFAQENSCAERKVVAYFQKLEMPGANFRCAEERKPFT